MRRRADVRSAVVGLVFLLAGCSDSSVAGNDVQKSAPSGPVRFVVVAEGSLFVPGSELCASLWSAEQLDSLSQNARCGVSTHPDTGAEEVRCPDGVEYREVIPEAFAAPVHGGLVHLEFQSERVEVGEEFRLLLSGRSSDGCNTTTATRASRAESQTIRLDDLDWETTMRGCAG